MDRKCEICDCEVFERENFYYIYEPDLEKAYIHSDCFIRELESGGRSDDAKLIMDEDRRFAANEGI